MTFKEKLAQNKFYRGLDTILHGLKMEFTEDFSYVKNPNELEALKESQKYAKILYDVISEAKAENDLNACTILKSVVVEYGMWKEGSSRGATRGPGVARIFLALPKEIKVKLDGLNEKYLKNKKLKQENLGSRIENIEFNK